MVSIDIAIPCYQHGRFLRDSVRSVLGQGIADLRVLIIDNASTDESLAVADELAAMDRRVSVVAHARNLGPHTSFNEAVDWAASQYFMVLCADDLLTPGSLARAAAVMEANPDVTFAYGTDFHWGGQGAPPMPASAEAWRRRSPPSATLWRIESGWDFIVERCRKPERYIAAGMVLVRTAAHKAAGYYRPELPHTDDFEMLLRLACLGRVAATGAAQGIKRMHGANRTNEFLAERTRDLVERVAALECFFRNEGRSVKDADRLLRLGRRSISERAYWCGMKDLSRGRRSAYDLFRLAVRLDPRVVFLPPLNYLFRA